MGAWGTGVFENDSALDFLAEMTEAGHDGPLIDVLIETLESPPDAYLDVDVGAAVLAGAELVACLMGRGATEVPAELAEWISDQEPDVCQELVAKHRGYLVLALARVSQPPSEIWELWKESGEFEAWEATVRGLTLRLEPV